MVAWGVTHVFGMVGHSNLGFADAMRRAEEARRSHLRRDPPRGGGGVRGLGLRQAHRPARRAASRSPVPGPPTCSPGSTTPRSTARRCSRSRARCRPRCWGAVRSRTSTSTARSRLSRQYSKTVLPESDHAELMTLALKHATVERDVAHLVFPDEVQVKEIDDAERPSGPTGRIGDTRHRAADGGARRRPRTHRGGAPPGDRRRPRCAVRDGRRAWSWPRPSHAPVMTTFKAKGQISDHHPLGAGVLGRSGTPVASWLMNESDLLIVLGASFSNHTGHRGVQADRPGRLRPDGARPVPSGRPCRCSGHAGVTARLIVERLAPGGSRVDQRADVAGPLGDLARREGTAGARRPRPRRGVGGGVRRDEPARTRRRGHGRRCRQPRLLVRSLLRVHAPVGADVGLPRLDRVRVPGRDGRVGGRRAGAPRSWR